MGFDLPTQKAYLYRKTLTREVNDVFLDILITERTTSYPWALLEYPSQALLKALNRLNEALWIGPGVGGHCWVFQASEEEVWDVQMADGESIYLLGSTQESDNCSWRYNWVTLFQVYSHNYVALLNSINFGKDIANCHRLTCKLEFTPLHKRMHLPKLITKG